MGFHGNHAFSYSPKIKDKVFRKLGVPMKNMAPCETVMSGASWPQIRSRGNCNLYLLLFSRIQHLDMIRKTD